MSLRHPKAEAWERRLREVLVEIDHELEEKYGGAYPLHPVRPERGATANPQQDGLFSVSAAFTPGFGSAHGPGYVLDIRIATLNNVPRGVVEKIERYARKRLKDALPDVFPGRDLDVVRDGHVLKIVGDISLGSA